LQCHNVFIRSDDNIYIAIVTIEPINTNKLAADASN